MKETPIYKVVTKDLKSAASVMPYWLPEMTIQYKVNEWTQPNLAGTGIMVFTDLEKVQKFFNKQKSKYVGEWIIFRGVGINVRPKERIVKINSKICIEKILSIWRAIGAFGWKRRPVDKYGFYTADMIKLTEIVTL